MCAWCTHAGGATGQSGHMRMALAGAAGGRGGRALRLLVRWRCLRAQSQKERKEQLGFTIEDMRQEYAVLADTIAKTNARVMNLTEEVGGWRAWLAWPCHCVAAVPALGALLCAGNHSPRPLTHPAPPPSFPCLQLVAMGAPNAMSIMQTMQRQVSKVKR